MPESLKRMLLLATFGANVFLGSQYRSSAASFFLTLGLGVIAGSVGTATASMLLSVSPMWMNAVAILCVLVLILPSIFYVVFPHPDAKSLWRGALLWGPAVFFGLFFE